MGFRATITPTRLATGAELVLDDTRQYASGALETFTIDPELFGGFDPLRIELISDPVTPTWMYGLARVFPPGQFATGLPPPSVYGPEDAVFKSTTTKFRAFLPIQPIGGQVTVTIRNVDSFAGPLGVRVFRLRGVQSFADLVRSSLDSAGNLGPISIGAGSTGTFFIKGSATIADRFRGVIRFNQTHDINLRWRDGSLAPALFLTAWTQRIATAVPADEVTIFDEPYLGTAEVELMVSNTAAIVGNLFASPEVVPRL